MRHSTKTFLLATVLVGAALMISRPAFAQLSDLNSPRCLDLTIQCHEAMEAKQWDRLVEFGQRRETECADVYNSKEKTGHLADLAIGMIQLHQADEAIPVLRRCLSLDPNFASCSFLLGAAYSSLGKTADARDSLKKCIAIGSTDPESASAIESCQILLKRIAEKYPEDSGTQDQRRDSARGAQHRYGTGFFISNAGHILTNDHVVAGCKGVATADGRSLEVIARDARNDLALLKASTTPGAVAVLRSGVSPKIGDSVVVFGFPLHGILSPEGIVTTGILSATSGIQGDVRFVQISAPVQPGNSGGPLLDASGHVIGVVEAKLDAIQVARQTGDLAQNVNFAVHWAAVRAFLDEQEIPYQKAISERTVRTADVAELARKISVALICSE